jgi:F-type H+-transporting ATPase subunit b
MEKKIIQQRYNVKNLLTFIPALMIILVMATVALASSEGGGHETQFEPIISMAMLWRVINFVILAAVLYKFMAQPLRDFFAGRREQILASLEEAKKSKEGAEARYNELTQRLVNRDQEFEEIRKNAIENAEKVKNQIIADAHDKARKMEEKARESIQQELKKAQESLKQEAAELALSMAEDKLVKEVTSSDQKRFMDEYISGLK